MSATDASPVRAILFALVANLAIAVCKAGAALVTGSSALVAEAVHSTADSANQVFLLIGLRGARSPADVEHPLGYGKLSYFWSFMVAILLFSVGGLFSIYEGWHKLHATQPLERIWLGVSVLVISILLEGLSLYGCLREVKKLRGTRSLLRWLKQTRSSELVVVLGEDLAALVGLVIALLALLAAYASGEPRFDAIGSIAIGGLLVAVAVFVGMKVKALLIGRSADPDVQAAIEAQIARDPHIERVFNVITVQMGARLMLAAKVEMRGDLPLSEACARINQFERELRLKFPEIGWCFVEPDIED